jgi:NAD-dependent dihydropyrimidine dehydrogenase PreA subunit
MFALRYLRNVTTLALDDARCGGCGMCVTVCPHAVFALDDGKARIVDRDACMECGACARNCPTGALSVQPGVGCAEAVLRGKLRGTPTDCSCSQGSTCCNGPAT